MGQPGGLSWDGSPLLCVVLTWLQFKLKDRDTQDWPLCWDCWGIYTYLPHDLSISNAPLSASCLQPGPWTFFDLATSGLQENKIRRQGLLRQNSEAAQHHF